MVSPQEVGRIAQLARLALTDDEAARFAAELACILDHMDVLASAGPPDRRAESTDASAPLRADAPAADPLHGPVAKLSPAFESGFFTVPRLAAMDLESSA